MAIVYKIHPAIGIARVGDSPDDFFIGPERVDEEPNPPGGFKDAQCRIKRQAARFRIFAHDDDDGTVQEINDADAEITWTVHLVNKKAAHPDRGNSESAGDLTIDPGSRTLSGPNQRELFNNGEIRFSGAPVTKVPLGEIRSDTDNHLLVLGGHGKSASPLGTGIGHFWINDDWYDDVSDGPVTATIKLRSDNSTPPVVGAWVIVAPPKYAPHQQSVITLYDRILHAMIDGGLLPAPTTTSYTNDVFPVLQRARDTRWVESVFPNHSWPDPVTSDALRNAIFNKLKAPGGGGGNMPQINDSGTGDDRLTATQYDHMERWRDDDYTNDWAGVPAPEPAVTPQGMDRSALEACVGAAFLPGIETGGLDDTQRPVLVISNYVEPFRLSHSAVAPGDLTLVMALPWQADFEACADNWWPVPRPNDVIQQGTGTPLRWDRNAPSAMDMVNKWNTLGFVVRQGAQNVEVEVCDTPTITLLTPALNFQDVPTGPMGIMREAVLAISFDVISPATAVTLQYAPMGGPAHPQLVAFNTSVTVGPTAGNSVASARFWVIYRTSAAGDVLPQQTVTIQDSTGTQSWTVTIDGNTVARKTAATALVLDRSGSMSEDAGNGQTKHKSLQQAASIFVDVMLEGDAVGVVRFNENSQMLQPVVTLGAGGLSDINRNNTKDTINGAGLNPTGATSIGDGIFEGRGILNATSDPFDVKSLVVLTDGVENSPRMIADVAAEINEFTYAVGLGKPQNISVPALQNISGNNGGYLLITGPIDQDNRFLLQKYFLQILAGISNAEIVLDPSGRVTTGRVERVPFQLTAGDAGVDVILLTPNTKIVDFRLQTPNGFLLEPWRAMSDPGMRFVISEGVTYYRLVLPTELEPNRFDGGGTWHALLKIGRPQLEPSRSPQGVDRSIIRGMFAAPQRPRRPAVTTGLAQLRRANMLAAARLDPAAGASNRRVAAAVNQQSAPYSLIVHAYSNISLRAFFKQTSFEPGARVEVFATLAQSGIPLENAASAWMEVTRPNDTTVTVPMTEIEGGEFAGAITAAQAGVYRMRVIARGKTSHGEPFTRERTLTAPVWRGDLVVDPHDQPSRDPGGEPGDHRGDCTCRLLMCLLREGVISPELERRLREFGVSLDQARKCVESFCNCRRG
ncbi:MAG TPA: LodA/GoxA family CTQ-dependent oxidase [Pyrinomonadaceae bacterium]|nr:LodA/GoxA family CTQ-dependent oxidase [Pyrinomonadaceae bacterium]